MRTSLICVVALSIAVAVSAQPKDVAGQEPRCRQYDVQHPVYSHDHSVWNLVRTSEKADEWVGISDEQLRSHIDEVGHWSGDNKKWSAS
jgi:hypothetical protein